MSGLDQLLHQAGLPGLDQLLGASGSGFGTDLLSKLGSDLSALGGDLSGVGGAVGGALGGALSGVGAGLADAGKALSNPVTQQEVSRLFPRASLPTSFDGVSGRPYDPANPMGGPGAGAPMGGAPGGAANAGGQREYKRPKFLDSTRNLDEVLDDGIDKVRPVIEP